MAKVTFKKLWSGYPDDDHPCRTSGGKSSFSNQCAIRVGVALTASGVKTASFPGVAHCWHHKKAEGHVLRAEELANGLNKKRIHGIAPGKVLTAKDFKSQLAGKTGIIFFKDYWQRSRDSEGNPTGDHIDLWNGSRLTSTTSWFRIQWGIVLPGYWSDLEKAKSITFWAVA